MSEPFHGPTGQPVGPGGYQQGPAGQPPMQQVGQEGQWDNPGQYQMPMGGPGQYSHGFPSGVPTGAPVENQGVRVGLNERPAFSVGGGLALVMLLLILGAAVFTFSGARSGSPAVLVGPVLFLVFLVGASSLTVVNPGETKVLQFFGRYIGTIRQTGLLLTVPMSSKKTVSVKVRNFETHELKVNDADGNPVNIAAIVVWQVTDTARSVFAVENYGAFVAVQAEAALRHVATSHPYDNAAPGVETLRGSTELVAKELAQEVAERVAIAGIEIVEARISSLAYAPEIAQAMLQRQQAAAVISARGKIVEGAVGMVHNALHQLEESNIVTLSDEHKATMVSNLLVVLCSDSRATPVVNTSGMRS